MVRVLVEGQCDLTGEYWVTRQGKLLWKVPAHCPWRTSWASVEELTYQ